MKKITFFLIITFALIFNNLKADADLENKLQEMQDEIDALAEMIEEGSGGGDGWYNRTSLGGYGEIHWSTASTPIDETATGLQVILQMLKLIYIDMFYLLDMNLMNIYQ